MQDLSKDTRSVVRFAKTFSIKERVPCPSPEQIELSARCFFMANWLGAKTHPETANMTSKSPFSRFSRDFCSSLDAPGAGEPVEPIFLSRLARRRMEQRYAKEQICFCSNRNRQANSGLLK
jgi:hypothetical protein